MAAQKGMILLETKNAILHEQVKQRLVDGRRDRDETVREIPCGYKCKDAQTTC
jgi:hypothetical protein